MNRWILILCGLWFTFQSLLNRHDSLLHIVFCDVGQGDAILISLNRWQMLIDGGYDDSVLNCLDQNMSFWDRQLEVVVATHADADHIGGLPSVLDGYTVNLLLTNGQTKETTDFTHLQQAAQREMITGGAVRSIKNGEKLQVFDDLFFHAWLPLENPSQNQTADTKLPEIVLSDVNGVKVQPSISHNDWSIVLLLQYKQLEVLFTGDLEIRGEEALLANELITGIDILKVAHHGSKTSTTEKFLDITAPKISVISAGKNNRYGHPNLEVVERLAAKGGVIIRTDQEGPIHLISDGHFVWWKRTNQF